MTTIQHSVRRQAPEGVVLRELSWLTYRTPLWAAWHKINLRPLVEQFRQTLVRLSSKPDASTTKP